MAPPKMHADQVETDPDLVRQLLHAQFPQWATCAVEAVPFVGTVNAVYRVGDDLVARLPLRRSGVDDLAKEREWLPRLAPLLPLAVPEIAAAGKPGSGYPFPWTIYRWINGRTYSREQIGECEGEAAADLAAFVCAIRRIDHAGAPRSGRKPLGLLDGVTRDAILRLPGSANTAAVTAAWEASLRTPAWEGAAVWRHGDLLPSNLLVDKGRLSAVLDFGSSGAGDPAADIVPAWSVFSDWGRRRFRDALDPDDGTWARARGYALHQALLIIPYYRETHPAFVAMAEGTVGEVLKDLQI